MQIKATIAPIIGTVTDTHWSQIIQLPHVYGVVEIVAPDAVARSRGMQIIAKLERLLDPSVVSLEGVADIADTLVEEGLKTLLIFVPVGEALYIVLRGRGLVYLKRGDKLALLLDKEGGVSGKIATGDILIGLSNTMGSAIAVDEVSHVFDHLSAEEVAEKLITAMHQKEELPAGAALVFATTLQEALDEQTSEGPGVVTAVALPQYQEELETRQWKNKLLLPVREVAARWKDRISRWKRMRISRLSLQPLPLVTGAIALLFVTSVFLGIIKQRQQTQNRQITKTVVEAQRVFDEGMALLDLNPVKARERLNDAKVLLEPVVKTVSARSKEGREVSSLYTKIADNLTQAMRVVRVEPELFFDVSLLKKNARATNISITDDTVGMVDGPGATAYALGVSTKNGQVVAGGEGYRGAQFVAAYGDKIYTLAASGIHMARTGDTKTILNVVPKASEWGQISALVAFGGNLYLLDTQKSRIWKYVATETGFSELREYLNPDTLPNFSHATSMAIDGSVWIGTTDGKILRFTQGKENTFIPKGVDPAFGSDLVVFTSADTSGVYVLDRQQKRVVMLDKDGMYLAQYVWQGDMTPTQVVVSEKAKKIILLADGKLYSIGLK